MKTQKLFISKWFYYFLTGFFLLALSIGFLPSALNGNDISANFLSETWGLFFTLVIFVMLFELRESLEWKSVEDRVKRRIGKRIHAIFIELSTFCEVNRVLFGEKIFDDEAWKELENKQLEELTSKEIRLNDFAKEALKDTNTRLSLASTLDSRRAYLSEVEAKYFKFLDSELQTYLMDIQDYLEALSFELRVRRSKEQNFHKSIAKLIGKIMKEIAHVRQSDINIGF